MANIPVGGQIVLNKSLANIDARFGPYSSIQSAYNAVVDTCDEIIAGLHFGIIQNDGSIKEYVWTLTGGTASNYKEVGEGGGSTVTVVDSLNSTSSTAALSAKQGKVLSEQIATKLSSPIQISDVAGLQNALNNAGSSGSGGTSVTVVDNLTSDSSTSALSAKQGKVLNGICSDLSDSLEEVQASIAVTKDEHNNIKDSISTIEYTAGSSNVALAGGKVSTRSGSIAIGSLSKTNVTTNPSWGSPYMANATAIGYSTEANGYFSTAVGIEAIASNVYSTAYGVLNKPTTNSIVTIGCGYRNTDSNGTLIKINAFETDTDQKVYIRGIGGYTGQEATDAAKAGKDVQAAFNAKQDKLTAGEGITISSNNTISADLSDVSSTINTAINSRALTRYNDGGQLKGYVASSAYNSFSGNENTVVLGANNSVSSHDSFTVGNHNTNTGYAATVLGANNVSTGRGSLATGEYNKDDSDASTSFIPLFTIGNGTSTQRSNAFLVEKSGKVYINGIGGYDGTNAKNSATKDLVSALPTFEQLTNGNLKLTFEGESYILNKLSTFHVTVTASPSTGGHVLGSGNYTEGQVFHLYATASEGFHFVKWNDNNTEPNREVIASSNMTAYTATFEADE